MYNFKKLTELVNDALNDYNNYASSVREAATERRKILNSDLYLEVKWERYETLKTKLDEVTK